MTPRELPSQFEFRLFMAAFAAAALIVIGCADFGTGLPPAADDGGAIPTVSFAAHLLPVFQANCSGNLCHIPCTPGNGGGLCLVSYAELMSEGVVSPGDAQNSILTQYLDGRRIPRMPYGQLPLPDSMITRIRTWIDEGAQDN